MLVNFFLFFYLLISFPKIFLQKKSHFLSKFLGSPPKGKNTIWIHAVSVGEVKAALPLFLGLKKKYPDFFFLVTTTTHTGQEEAKKSFQGADAYRFLPFDFSWTIRRWLKKLDLKFFVLVESDFWPNLLLEIKKTKAKIILVSGKISERSFRRFLFFPYFAKKIFSCFDLICAQSELHKNRFLPFVSDPGRIHIAGNLKFEAEPILVDYKFWKKKLALPEKVVAFSCTHPSEEAQFLKIFPLDRYFLILIPRHPERFESVAKLLSDQKISFFRWSQLEKRRGDEKVLLVDSMGQLPIIYSLSRLAIVGGSYTKKVGGHNILEPTLYDTPVFFGPYMFNQSELEAFIVRQKAGKQVPMSILSSAIDHFFENPKEELRLREAAQLTRLSSKGFVRKILNLVEKIENV